jgi:hypothetical protein
MQHQNQWYVQVNGQSYGPYSIAQMISYIGEGRIIASSLISQDPSQGFGLAVGFPVFSGQLAPYASPQILQQAHSQNQLTQPPNTQPLNAPPDRGSQQNSVPDETLKRVAPLASAPRQIRQTAPQPGSQSDSQPVVAEAQSDIPLALTPEMSVPHGAQGATSPAGSLFLIMAEVTSENRMLFLQTLQKIGTPQRIGEANWLMQSNQDIDEVRNYLAAALTRQDRLFIMDSVNNRTAWFNVGTDMAKRIKALWKAP